MEAAINRILSKDIDIDPSDVPDFRESESGSEAEQESSAVSSEEEEEEEDGEEGSEFESGEEESDIDADLREKESMEGATSSSDEEDAEGPHSTGAHQQRQQQLGFLEGGKADAFARAFARIMEGTEAEPRALAAPILTSSKSIAAHKAEGEAQAKADRAAKRLRQEMRQRGHVVPKRKGDDPTADVREKALQKTATRGVVRLFNAVAKAQRRVREAEEVTGSRAKAAKLGKASFLAELRGARGAAAQGEAVVPSAKAAATKLAPRGGVIDSDDDEGGDAGWAVLQKGFTGLQGGSKMKDWDKELEAEEEGEDAGADDDSESDN